MCFRFSPLDSERLCTLYRSGLTSLHILTSCDHVAYCDHAAYYDHVDYVLYAVTPLVAMC